MEELINTFKKLQEYLNHGLTWHYVEELYEQAEHDNESDGSDSAANILQLSVVQKALANDEITSTLLELCSTIRELRDDAQDIFNDSTHCNWDILAKVVSPEKYLALIYALAGLPQLKVNTLRASSYRLALIVVDAYFLTLTIPGATVYHVFEENIFIHCMQNFKLIGQLCNLEPFIVPVTPQRRSELWIQFCTLCEDLQMVFRYVHFKDHLRARDMVIKKCVDIQYFNHKIGYMSIYAADIHQKSFEIFEEMINTHNGNIKDTLSKIMNMTAFLHSYTAKPKSIGFSVPSSYSACEHISDWFIGCVTKYPRVMVDVLSTYIECIVTNPVRGWGTESLQRAMDYAAKYDAALFTKCNSSCLEFLCKALYSDEANIRCRAVELLGKILQLDSEVDWQMFRHEVSNVPREVNFIKELIDSFQDSSDNVKLKAVQALLSILHGSSNSRNIFVECIKNTKYSDEGIHLPEEPKMNRNELRFTKPTTNTEPINYSFPGHEIIEPSMMQLPRCIFKYLYKNSVYHVRKTGIMLMEELIKLNPMMVYNTDFISESVKMINEPTPLVRKQLLQSIDSVLEVCPNSYPVIWAWCKIITPMMRDNEVKNIELAMECFTCRVLKNIRGIDRSDKPVHFMPWVIIRTLLLTESRYYLQNCFHRSLHSNMISKNIVDIIESYLLTSYSTEAWVLLNFVKSAKVKSVEPDALINHFISFNSWNKEQNMLIALEVLCSCIEEFSLSALNHAFSHILSSIKEGKMLPLIIGKAIDLLLLIDNRSQSMDKNGVVPADDNLASKVWILDLHEYLEEQILDQMKNFPQNHGTYLCLLYAYSEINMHTRRSPQEVIITFLQKFMTECLKLSETNLDLENERLLNSMIFLCGRFALRDSLVAQSTCSIYAKALRIIDRPPVVNTIMVALTDLCKKHTYIVEGILSDILKKLSSSYDINRIETFKCFEKLILQDQLKLRGTLLLFLLTAIIDSNVALSNRAKKFFDEYTTKKNRVLFRKCLFECPFILNEYNYFDGLEEFTEANIRSPLKGDAHEENRQTLYEYILRNVDNINQIAYFGQLKILTDKRQHERLITAEGVVVIQDILFILKRICLLITDELKLVGVNENIDNGTDELGDDPLDNIAGENDAINTKKPAGKRSVGRGARKRELTLAEATCIFENSLNCIPILYREVSEKYPTIGKSMDSLCTVIYQRFPQILEYAQPRAFWQNYMPRNENRSDHQKKKSSSRNTESDSNGNVTQTEEEQQEINSPPNDSDLSDVDGVPLSNLKKRRTNITDKGTAKNCDEASMKYIFNINT